MNDKTPFNSPRDPAQPPYYLRNGLSERAEIDRHEAEHRRRMGMSARQQGKTERARFEAWLVGEYGVVSDNRKEMMWLAWQAAQR